MNNQAAQTMPELPEPSMTAFTKADGMTPFWHYDGVPLVREGRRPDSDKNKAIYLYTANQVHQYARDYAAMLAAAPAASGGEDVPTFVELHNRFLSDTSQIPDEYQDWRAEFANDLLKRAVIEMTTQPSTPPAGASVSERARELLEQSRNGRALRNDGLVEVGQAIDALEQALTQQRGDGKLDG